MKLLSIIVPCYNSENYMERAINSALLGGQAVEIVIVDDGSSDKTPEIADHYAQYFPEVVQTVHQKNGGPGEAINAGLRHATGQYIKILDSDDWLDFSGFQQILNFLRELEGHDQTIDLLISNYVYDKQGARRTKAMHYGSFMPIDREFTWADVNFSPGKYMLMHSAIYRKAILEAAQVKLPKHRFYVDNLYVFAPLPFVKNMYYIDTTVYHYFIGRDDQSINEDVMIQRIDQQLAVNKEMVQIYDQADITDPHLRNYMENYLQIITAISSIFLIKDGTPESLHKKDALWAFIEKTNPDLYSRLHSGFLGHGVNLPGRLGRHTAIGAYRIVKRIYGFN
ncbi:MAG: glycosyltransferase [Lactobacillus sp.]|nr:glycosyltransferase [Lactobacillus sp.]